MTFIFAFRHCKLLTPTFFKHNIRRGKCDDRQFKAAAAMPSIILTHPSSYYNMCIIAVFDNIMNINIVRGKFR